MLKCNATSRTIVDSTGWKSFIKWIVIDPVSFSITAQMHGRVQTFSEIDCAVNPSVCSDRERKKCSPKFTSVVTPLGKFHNGRQKKKHVRNGAMELILGRSCHGKEIRIG